jgi:hypothetical protein
MFGFDQKLAQIVTVKVGHKNLPKRKPKLSGRLNNRPTAG